MRATYNLGYFLSLSTNSFSLHSCPQMLNVLFFIHNHGGTEDKVSGCFFEGHILISSRIIPPMYEVTWSTLWIFWQVPHRLYMVKLTKQRYLTWRRVILRKFLSRLASSMRWVFLFLFSDGRMTIDPLNCHILWPSIHYVTSIFQNRELQMVYFCTIEPSINKYLYQEKNQY
jgi:hypothetical protein